MDKVKLSLSIILFYDWIRSHAGDHQLISYIQKNFSIHFLGLSKSSICLKHNMAINKECRMRGNQWL